VFEFFLLNPIFHLIEDKKNKNMYGHFQRTQVFHFFSTKTRKMTGHGVLCHPYKIFSKLALFILNILC